MVLIEISTNCHNLDRFEPTKLQNVCCRGAGIINLRFCYVTRAWQLVNNHSDTTKIACVGLKITKYEFLLANHAQIRRFQR